MSEENSHTRRRDLLRTAALAGAGALLPRRAAAGPPRRPNILFAIADDQSWTSTGATGDPIVKTPNFDRVARQGVLFTQAICASPGCAPSRAAILTGKYPWQLEEAGTHASVFPNKFQVFPDLLQAAGYHVGLTGKGAGPCNYEAGGWKRNPAGPAYDARRLKDAPKAINSLDYAANFQDFLVKKGKDQPFCFWFGSTEPHRVYAEGSGIRSGKRPQDVAVPRFLPDAPEVRSDLLDYYLEIEHFDTQLGRALRALEQAGELSNTIVVVTADNGMPFPRAKAFMNEYGIHLPLAVCWPEGCPGGRKVEDLVAFVDFAPTFLEAAGVKPPGAMTGRSFLGVLTSKKSGRVDPKRSKALSGRERHSHSRFDNLGYPARAIRTHEFLYVRNFKPDLWPAGDPERFHDIDDGPTKTYVLENRGNPKLRRFFELACGKHPAEELYDIRKDPACLENLAASPSHGAAATKLRQELERDLKAQMDPRILGTGDVFDSYPRFSPMRPELGGFAEQGKYNPKYQRK
jgi:uncharacterized sulfatase